LKVTVTKQFDISPVLEFGQALKITY